MNCAVFVCQINLNKKTKDILKIKKRYLIVWILMMIILIGVYTIAMFTSNYLNAKV